MVHIHHSSVVIEISTIVFGAENGHQLFVLAKEPIPILHNLVSTADQVKVMSVQAFFELLMPENISTASFIFFPAAGIFIRIVPEQISYETAVWYFARFRNTLNLLKALHIFRNATVHTHNFLVYQGHEWHGVETVVKLLPDVDFVSPFHFVEKSINTSDGLRFVVSSQNYDLVRESDFKCKKKTDDFCALFASIDIIT